MTRFLGAWLITALGVSSLGCPSTVTPPPVLPPVITRFTVDQARVAKGGAVQFSFAVQGANAVSLVDQSGAELPVTFDATSGIGNATHTPAATSFYVLRALGEGGRDAAFLQVAVDEELASLFLVLVPRTVKAGEAVDVVWSAAGLTDVSVTEGQRTLSTMATGTASDTPAKSTTYTLSAKQADGTFGTLTADVVVQPVIEEFLATPPAAMPGETITLSWKTGGGERVSLSEATFGALHETTTDVASGEFAFVVPATYGADGGVSDGGVADGGTSAPPVREGLPLRFTLALTTTTPAQSASAAVDGRVGKGAVIDRFEVPQYVTAGKPLAVGWTVRGARVALSVDGALVFAPPAGQVLDGRFMLPPLTTPRATVTLEAWDDVGLSTRASAVATVVAAPAITSFTVPASVSSPGPIQAAWQTTGATRLVLHLEDGPNVFASTGPTEVASGTASIPAFMPSTLVLEASNAAGDVATAKGRTAVGGSRPLSFTPQPCAAGQPLVAQWDVSAIPLDDLPGLPGGSPQLSTSATGFIDLDQLGSAKALRFGSDEMARFDGPDGFRFPFVTRQVTRFSVSANGVLVLGDGAVGSTNADVGQATYAGPALLAPFWDDLVLGATGTVKYDVEGNSFPRRLIVQWSKLQLGATSGTELTFQVQLEETGAFRFVYKTLKLVGTGSATIGAVDTAGTFAAAYGFNTPGKVGEGQTLSWFSGEISRAQGSHPYLAPRTGTFGFFVQDSMGKLTLLASAPQVIARGEVVIDEVMATPDVSAPQGRFIELANVSDRAIDLTGLDLVSASSSGSPWMLSFSLDAGARIVLGQTRDPAGNGGANVSIAWPAGALDLSAADTVELRTFGSAPFIISSMSWNSALPDAGAVGESVQANLAPVTASGAPLTCPRVSTYGGPPPQLGTPGAPPDNCFEYRLERIPVAWDEIAGVGRPLVTGADDRNDAVDVVTLAAPLRYFGQSYGTVTVSTNGWVFPGQINIISAINRVTPAQVTSSGLFGPFWDDLLLPADRAGANVYVARRANHTIIEWYRAAHGAAPGDEINAQVKLFDDGVIEYHYGALVSSTSLRYAEGSSATAWVERPVGVQAALPIVASTNPATATSFLAPRTAWRFTPNP